MDKATPSVSVIIPVLNARETLSRTLDSVVGQQHAVEIIVIDGGSTDGSLELLNDYEAHISYFETGKDRGIADAFNRGISRASGEFIAILNADDTWVNSTLRGFFNTWRECPDGDVYHGSIRYWDGGSRSYVLSPRVEQLKWRMTVFHPTMFVRRTAYAAVGGYDEAFRLAMDSEWVHRALVSGARFVEVPDILAMMRLGGRSDRHWCHALAEYRLSVRRHNLLGPLPAAAAFAFFGFGKLLRRSVAATLCITQQAFRSRARF